jgi:hypothetical protein
MQLNAQLSAKLHTQIAHTSISGAFGSVAPGRCSVTQTEKTVVTLLDLIENDVV